MDISLSSLNRLSVPKPPRIVIYWGRARRLLPQIPKFQVFDSQLSGRSLPIIE